MNKSEDWEVDQIEKVCKSLKNSKARDECGLIYELFKPPYAGPAVYGSLCKLEVNNRINIHTVYRMTSYRIQYSLVPIAVYGPKKQVNFKKYR